jgi:hypothetical protein
MMYIAELMSQPGREVAAAALVGRHETLLIAGRQDVLDEPAKLAYRRRVQELRAEIDEADDDADLERAAKARLELDQLIEELGRLTGLGGRSRSFDDASERARTSVQKAIRRALATVSEADPLLGSRLERSIVTGVRCVYMPLEAADA